jgi:hypothetical protein
MKEDLIKPVMHRMPPGQNASHNNADEGDGVLKTGTVVDRLWVLINHDECERNDGEGDLRTAIVVSQAVKEGINEDSPAHPAVHIQ